MGLVNRACGRGRFSSYVIIYQGFNEKIKIILKLYLLYVCVHTLACMHISYMWRPEDNLQELVLSFYHVSPGNQT